MSDHRLRPIWRTPLLTWLALLLLLGATAYIAYIPLGNGNAVISLGIGAIKAALIGLFFMHLKRSSGTLWLASLTGFVFLFTLFLLTFGDYMTRPRW